MFATNRPTLVASGGLTFAQHMALAQAWVQGQGRQGTEAQSLRVMREIDAETLRRVLTERGVALPIGVPQR
jgi:hypothetical protein